MQLDTSDTDAVSRFFSIAQDAMQDTSEIGAESRFFSVAQDEISISICEKGIWTPVEAESTFIFPEKPKEGCNFGGAEFSETYSEEIPHAQESGLWWMPQIFQCSPSDIRHEMRQYH